MCRGLAITTRGATVAQVPRTSLSALRKVIVSSRIYHADAIFRAPRPPRLLKNRSPRSSRAVARWHAPRPVHGRVEPASRGPGKDPQDDRRTRQTRRQQPGECPARPLLGHGSGHQRRHERQHNEPPGPRPAIRMPPRQTRPTPSWRAAGRPTNPRGLGGKSTRTRGAAHRTQRGPGRSAIVVPTCGLPH